MRVLGLVVVALSLLVTGRVAYVAYGPTVGERAVPAQVRFLQSAIDSGAGLRMQQLFPEGAYFLTALTASAAARSAAPDLGAIRTLRDELDRPASVAVFGSGMVPEHGIFQAGWALVVAVDLATASRDPADLADVTRRAEVIDAAFRTSRTGFLEGYPRQFWPCDSVVGASALARAGVLLDRQDWLATVRSWRATVSAAADPGLGLLPHRVDEAGTPLEGPRGSSQSIIQAFWPTIGQALDGTPDRRLWARFTSAFVVREAGLVGVREFPVGTDGAGDVDSGPLVLGVSASASAVGLAAAREVGDTDLAQSLDREAELLGLPLRWAGQRRYALGVLPVGDAFLAWARSRPRGTDLDTDRPEPWWPVLLVLAAVPALVVGPLLWADRRRIRRRSRLGGWPAP